MSIRKRIKRLTNPVTAVAAIAFVQNRPAIFKAVLSQLNGKRPSGALIASQELKSAAF
jgi:hypothetical protein